MYETMCTIRYFTDQNRLQFDSKILYRPSLFHFNFPKISGKSKGRYETSFIYFTDGNLRDTVLISCSI